MKARYLLILFALYTTYGHSQMARTETQTQEVTLNPGDKNGFLGTVTMIYTFGNCFGDAIMAFGYKDLNISKVQYDGRTYTAKDLEIPNFDKYKLDFSRIEADISFSYKRVTSKVITTVLDKYDIGCFGETMTVSSKNEDHNNNLNKLSVRFKNAEYGMSLLLSSKIDAFEKRKLDTKAFNSLMFEAGSTDNLESRLEILIKALKLAPTEKSRTSTKIEIENIKKAIAEKNNEAENNVDQKVPPTATGIVLNSTSTPNTSTPKVEAVKSKSSSTYSYIPPDSYNETETMSRNNNIYRQNFSGIDKAADQLNDLIGSMMDRKQRQREAQERANALKEERIENEKKRKERFYNRADRQLEEINAALIQRMGFFAERQNQPTYNIDGSGFEPIYIVYAYTPKGYDRYYNRVRYPSTMEIRPVIENPAVHFSTVMAIFPYSNGSYPFYNDIKQNILKNHLAFDQSEYDIIFLDAETSVDSMIISLTKSMNEVVYDYGFSSAIPSDNYNITFLNDKVVDANATDYWSGGIQQNSKKNRINYFQTSDTVKRKKVDSFGASPVKKKNKVDFWTETKVKVDSTKLKDPRIKNNNEDEL